MGVSVFNTIFGISQGKTKGMHLADLKYHTENARVCVDVSFTLRSVVNGNLSLDDGTARQIAEALHVSEDNELPDTLFLAIDRSITGLIKWMKEDLEAIPVLVFDGNAPPAKAEEKEKRRRQCEAAYRDALTLTDPKARAKKMRAAIYCSWDMQKYAMSVCDREQVEFYTAVSEADHLIAFFSRIGFVDLVFTEDSDLIALGARKIVYGTFRSRGASKKTYDAHVYDRATDLFKVHLHEASVNVTREYDLRLWLDDHVLLFAALCGCDYGKMLSKCGPV